MANTIQYGISQVHVAIRNEDGTYETPVHIPGGENLSMSNSGSGDFTIWADNSKYWNKSTSSGKEGDLQMAKFPVWFYQNVLGMEVPTQGGVSENYDADPKQFALMWQLEGNGGGRRVVWYGCTASVPTFTSATATDSPTEANESSTITASYVQVGDKRRLQYSCERGDALYNSFFDAVPLATTNDDATLASLTVGTLTLSPSFDRFVTQYTATSTSSTATVTATATDSTNATVTIKNGGTSVTSGSSATFSAGLNVLTVLVTNDDASKLYTVLVDYDNS